MNITFKREVYIERRRILKEEIGTGRILLLGNEEASMNYADNHYPFRQDSTFLYYFGLDKPGLIGLIDIDRDEDILFGEELSIDDIIWTGPLPKLTDLADQIGVTIVKSKAAIINHINADIHFLPPYRGEQTITIGKLIGKKVRKVEKRASKKLIKAVIAQREIKSPEEIREMQIASEISHKMHLEVMKAARPGMKEYELVGIASKVLYDHNVGFAYPPIMTINGQTLHNHGHENTLEEGRVILFDGGGESPSHYAGDITRSFPVGPRFTDQQRQLYDIVHRMYTESVAMCRPGVSYRDVHARAAQILVEGFADLGLVKGNVDEAFALDVHTLFFPHGLGHMIGLDVHDMENLGEEYVGYGSGMEKSKAFGWKSLRLGKELKEGFVITIEPGIYMIPELIDKRREEGIYADFIDYDALEAWKGVGGIRLEDDYVIEADGASMLGIEMPMSADEIEGVRAEAF